jgi:hypothetical protein
MDSPKNDNWPWPVMVIGFVLFWGTVLFVLPHIFTAHQSQEDIDRQDIGTAWEH